VRTTTPETSGPTVILTTEQRERLAALATRLDLAPRATIYKEGAAGEHVFVNSSGVVKVFRDLPSGKRRIVSFWYPGDLFGLAERGKYVCSAQTVTEACVYRIPREALTQVLVEDGHLQFQFLVKVTHEFREVQREKILLTRRDAVGKLATFFKILEEQEDAPSPDGSIAVPMTRADISNFLGLTPEAVSRATRELTRRKLVSVTDRHTVRVLDRERFEQLVSKI
jgi:CRP-like cAMP-binding protein